MIYRHTTPPSSYHHHHQLSLSLTYKHNYITNNMTERVVYRENYETTKYKQVESEKMLGKLEVNLENEIEMS